MRRAELSQQHEDHLNLVEQTHAEFIADVEHAAASDGKVVVLTFDLEKALDTPSLTTSVAFYSRQLWTYNLCVYDEGERRPYMYVWSENVASRGGQEIGSCVIKHLKNHIPENTTKVICYSDSCGGQNRNIKMTMLLKKYLHDLLPENALETIEQKFFVSGHSYNSCDRCFGLIEKKRKISSEIYTPDDWVNLIKNSKTNEPKFNITKMQSVDFVSSIELESVIVNRKKNIDGEKINWLKVRVLKYRRDEPFAINMTFTDGTYHVVNIKKKNQDEESFAMCDLPSLYPAGNAISKLKYDDLMKLLKYLPTELHDFYINLKHDGKEEDYGLASDISDEDDD